MFGQIVSGKQLEADRGEDLPPKFRGFYEKTVKALQAKGFLPEKAVHVPQAQSIEISLALRQIRGVGRLVIDTSTGKPVFRVVAGEMSQARLVELLNLRG